MSELNSFPWEVGDSNNLSFAELRFSESEQYFDELSYIFDNIIDLDAAKYDSFPKLDLQF